MYLVKVSPHHRISQVVNGLVVSILGPSISSKSDLNVLNLASAVKEMNIKKMHNQFITIKSVKEEKLRTTFLNQF